MVNAMVDLHVIHKSDGYIVFHPESLSLFSVSEDLGKILEFLELESPKYDLEALEMYNSDIRLGEVIRFFDKLKIKKHGRDLTWINMAPKTLCLFISQDCNLRCNYCFASHGAFGGEEKSMTINTAKACVDKLLSKNSNNFIVFFGGEPFLNFPLMKEIVEYGRQSGLNIKYTTVTNGTIMNDAIETFITDHLFHLCVSLDGPKEINDMQRYGNVGSVHDKVVSTIDKLNSKNISLSVKCTATINNINILAYIADYIGSLGIDSVAFAPADMIPQMNKILISDSDYESYVQNISGILVKNIKQLASGNSTIIVSPIFFILSQMMMKTRIIHHCSAGREYIAVTADGDVYPCHEFVGIEEFKMGNVNDDDFPGKYYDKIKSIFNTHSVYAFDECKSCWARFLCGGDCAVRSYIYTGDLFRPTTRKCTYIKSVLEALLPEIAEIFQDDEKTRNIMKLFDESKQINI